MGLAFDDPWWVWVAAGAGLAGDAAGYPTPNARRFRGPLKERVTPRAARRPARRPAARAAAWGLPTIPVSLTSRLSTWRMEYGSAELK